MLYMGEYTRDNIFGLKIDYPAFVKILLAYLINKKGMRVLLILHIHDSNESAESDENACRRVYDALFGYLAGDYNQSEIMHVIRRCDFSIGSRMHACIAAVSQEVSTVSIAYNRYSEVSWIREEWVSMSQTPG
jgi:colanic acid/amylovoran biosynthesis protein